jgi:hypothetical protein
MSIPNFRIVGDAIVTNGSVDSMSLQWLFSSTVPSSYEIYGRLVTLDELVKSLVFYLTEIRKWPITIQSKKWISIEIPRSSIQRIVGDSFSSVADGPYTHLLSVFFIYFIGYASNVTSPTGRNSG